MSGILVTKIVQGGIKDPRREEGARERKGKHKKKGRQMEKGKVKGEG